MDIRNIAEDLEIVRMIVSRWAEKYNVGELEYGLVMDKLEAAAGELRLAERSRQGGEEEPAAGTEEPGNDDVSSMAGVPEEKFTDIRVSAEDECAGFPEGDRISRFFVTDAGSAPGEEPAADTSGAECADVAPESFPIDDEEDNDLPTMSEIEREIIMHETGELPIEQEMAEAREYGRLRGGNSSPLRSLYDERRNEPGYEALSELAEEINAPADETALNERRKVLGEVMNQGMTTVGDTYSAHDNGVVAGVTGRESLRKAIGLNDKYLLIRDLFRGDAGLYERTIETLDSFGDLNEAVLYIHDNFNWDPASEGSRLLVEMLVHKLS